MYNNNEKFRKEKIKYEMNYINNSKVTLRNSESIKN